MGDALTLRGVLAPVLIAGLVAGAVVGRADPASARGGAGVVPHAEVTLTDLANAERTSRGLAPLSTHLQLVRLAREHAAGMAGGDDAGGECSDGRTLHHRHPLSAGVTIPWVRIRENVVCVEGAATDGHRLLMTSPTHRAKLLADDVSLLGVGAARATDGTLWATQIFLDGAPPPPLAAISEGLVASGATFGAGQAPYAVLSRSDVFADSLAGAALAAGRAPVLFTDGPTGAEPDPVLRARTRLELDRVLPDGATVYLLGGTGALSSAVADELDAAGYRVRRLGGATRVQTAAVVAGEVVRRYGAPDMIEVARSTAWPDALTGGAAAARNRNPLLLTGPDTVPEATGRLVAEHPGADRIVLGGPAAVGDAVVEDLDAVRVWGSTRAETALAVADRLFGPAGDRIVVVDGYDPAGWARALAWSSYSARHGAPQVIVGETVPDSVAAWLSELSGGVRPVFATGVSDRARAQVEQALAR